MLRVARPGIRELTDSSAALLAAHPVSCSNKSQRTRASSRTGLARNLPSRSKDCLEDRPPRPATPDMTQLRTDAIGEPPEDSLPNSALQSCFTMNRRVTVVTVLAVRGQSMLRLAPRPLHLKAALPSACHRRQGVRRLQSDVVLSYISATTNKKRLTDSETQPQSPGDRSDSDGTLKPSRRTEAP